jgi:class 3 adenylate cyclase
VIANAGTLSGGELMEPRIQYAQTKDGVSIAFYTVGEGMPVVWMPNMPFHHIQLGLQQPEVRRMVEWAAQKGRLIAYDARGCGLSDRDVTDFSLDTYVLDLEAVVDRLELERFALVGVTQSGPVAIAYAARHPGRVSHLVLNTAYSRGADIYRSPQAQAFRALRDQDWNIYTETIAHTFVGWSSGELAEQNAAYLRECVTQEVAQATWRAVEAFDVTDLLPQVRSPTLVIGQRGSLWVPVDLSRQVASRIPDASFVVLDAAPGFQGYEIEPFAKAIEEFVFEDAEAAAPPSLAAEDVHTILFTDVEGSTALTHRLGDAKAREVMREHERITRQALKAHGGSEVKTMGDGFMTSFSSATKALECAIALQRAFARHNESAEEPLKVRVGMNAGEPIAEQDPAGRGDLYGTAVNLAARIAGKASGSEILASDVVRQLVAGNGFMFSDRGETELRGFEDPVRLYEVRWRENA